MLPEWLEEMSRAFTGDRPEDNFAGTSVYWDDPADTVLDPWEGPWSQNVDKPAYMDAIAASMDPTNQVPEVGVITQRGDPPMRQQDRFQREKEDRETHAAKTVNIPSSRFFRGNADQEVGPWFHKFNNGRIPFKAMAPIMGSYLRGDAAASLRKMAHAAKQDGVNITLTGGYRDYATQVRLKAQKGDLAATPGQSNHGWGLAIDIGEGEQRNWVAKHGRKYGWAVLPSESWHFDFMGWDGKVPGGTIAAGKAKEHHPERHHPDRRGTNRGRTIAEQQLDPALASSLLNLQPKDEASVPDHVDWEPIGSSDDFATTMELVMPTVIRPMRPQTKPQGKGGKGPDKGGDTGGGKTGSGNAPNFGGGRVGRIKEQLYQGFMDAGEPAIARMVGSKDFDRWIMAESGYHQAAKSPANNQGQPNYGLFQFWAGHPWVNKYIKNGKFTATAYEQARLAVRYFNLHAKEIHQYAQQIQNGSYQGWG